MKKLYLIPNTLTSETAAKDIAPSIVHAMKHVRVFFVEDPKSARTLLKKLDPQFPLSECTYIELNEHTNLQETEEQFGKFSSQDMGIISEAGYPCVADPGANVVRLAHQKGMEVIPLPGASSIILALAASGLNGQNFAFNGYLPRDKAQRQKKIKSLEERSSQEAQTQIVMEAPHHNQSLLGDILNVCHPKTKLCIASDVTGPHQMVKTTSVGEWKKKTITFTKKPTLFLLLYN